MSAFFPHFMAGITVGVLSTGILGINDYPDINMYTALPIVAGIGGALTPDMDIKSTSSMLMYLFYVVLAGILFFTGYPLYGFLLLLYSLLPQFFHHRGFIHSFLFCILSSVGLFFICKYNLDSLSLIIAITCAYFFGFLTHVVLDEAD